MPLEPYASFTFRLEIAGVQTASFSEATLPDATTSTSDYREGAEAPYPKLSGVPRNAGTVVLRRGITKSLELYNWQKNVQERGAGTARQNVTLALLNEGGNTTASWNLRSAWPSKYESGSLSAKGSEIAIETLELQIEALIRVS